MSLCFLQFVMGNDGKKRGSGLKLGRECPLVLCRGIEWAGCHSCIFMYIFHNKAILNKAK